MPYFAYCYDRVGGQYTRLIPADILSPLVGIPARQHGCVGITVLPVRRVWRLMGGRATSRRYLFRWVLFSLPFSSPFCTHEMSGFLGSRRPVWKASGNRFLTGHGTSLRISSQSRLTFRWGPSPACADLPPHLHRELSQAMPRTCSHVLSCIRLADQNSSKIVPHRYHYRVFRNLPLPRLGHKPQPGAQATEGLL